MDTTAARALHITTYSYSVRLQCCHHERSRLMPELQNETKCLGLPLIMSI